eukprot:2081950-Rhodomonas_salina.2
MCRVPAPAHKKNLNHLYHLNHLNHLNILNHPTARQELNSSMSATLCPPLATRPTDPIIDFHRCARPGERSAASLHRLCCVETNQRRKDKKPAGKKDKTKEGDVGEERVRTCERRRSKTDAVCPSTARLHPVHAPLSPIGRKHT